MNTNLPTNFAFTNMDPPAGGGGTVVASQVRCPYCGMVGCRCGCQYRNRRCPWCGGSGGCGCGRWVMPGLNMPSQQLPGMAPPANTNLGTCDCTVDQKSPNKSEVTNMCLAGSVPVCVGENKCECKLTMQ